MGCHWGVREVLVISLSSITLLTFHDNHMVFLLLCYPTVHPYLIRAGIDTCLHPPTLHISVRLPIHGDEKIERCPWAPMGEAGGGGLRPIAKQLILCYLIFYVLRIHVIL